MGAHLRRREVVQRVPCSRDPETLRGGENGVAEPPEGGDEPGATDEPGPVELPIDGTLDLHAFHPREVKDLVPEYLRACREKGILEVRIVHGKGTGSLRRTVHAVLRRLPEVESFRLAAEDRGSWGATLVILHPLRAG